MSLEITAMSLRQIGIRGDGEKIALLAIAVNALAVLGYEYESAVAEVLRVARRAT